MQCPKCGTQQTDTDQCGSCGIYFAKYELHLKQKKSRTGLSENPKTVSTSRRTLVFVSSIIIAISSIVYLFTSDDDSSIPSTTMIEPIINNTATIEPIKNSVSQKLELSHPPKNAIERARNATVFIQTDWGTLGSGYIADANCRVITNRHVVEFDQAVQVKKAMESTEIRTAYIIRQQEILSEISRKKMMVHEEYMISGETRSSDRILNRAS